MLNTPVIGTSPERNKIFVYLRQLHGAGEPFCAPIKRPWLDGGEQFVLALRNCKCVLEGEWLPTYVKTLW